MSAATSTTQSHSAQTTAARAQAANPRKPGASGHGPETGTDLFAAMLSLLSATTDIPPDTSLTADAAPGDAGNPLLTPTDTSADPLARLLGWPGAPLPQVALVAAPSPASAATVAHPAPSLIALSASADGAASLNGTTLTPPGTAAVAAAPQGTPQTAPDLQGMHRLERSAAPDEQTLAALARSNGSTPVGGDGEARATPAATPAAPAGADKALSGAATTNPAPSEPASTARPTAWRSTVTGASATTASVQQQHASQSLNHSLSERLQVRLDAGNPVALRSTVTLDERFNPASTGDSPTLSAGLSTHSQASASGSGSFAGEQPGGGGEAGQDHPPALSTDNESPSESTRFDETLTGQDADEALGAWSSSPTLRQASLRVGDGGEEAIDIQLSMTGQELNVAFRTDNAEARVELRESAGESLSDLLQRSGIQLGNVSVGAQGQQQGRGAPAEPRPQPAGNVRSGNGTTAPTTSTPTTVAPRPRSDGSQPLDLFV